MDHTQREATMGLWEIFLSNQGPMIHKWKHYFPIYERHFAHYRGLPITFIEIGCGEGGSLQMWKKYFGPHAVIIGLDVRPECAAFEEDQISVRIGDQSDHAFLASVIEEFGAPDAVIDDGSHVMQHVNATFAYLYPRMVDRGVYIVEDLHTAYIPDFGGGLGRAGTFIEQCKALIDELNGEHTPEKQKLTAFTKSTVSMHFYDSIVAFEKGRISPIRGFRSAHGKIWPG